MAIHGGVLAAYFQACNMSGEQGRHRHRRFGLDEAGCAVAGPSMLSLQGGGRALRLRDVVE